jgi:hypothetical protein
MIHKTNQRVDKIDKGPDNIACIGVQPAAVPLHTDIALCSSLLRGVGVTSLVAPLISESSSIVEHHGLWANTTHEIIWPALFEDPFFADLCNKAGQGIIGPKPLAAARPTIQRVIIDLVLAAMAEEIQQMRVLVLSPRRNKLLPAATGLNRDVYRSAHKALLAAGITVETPGKRAWGSHLKGFQTIAAFSPEYRTYAVQVALQVAAKAGPNPAKERIPPEEAGKAVIKLLNAEDHPRAKVKVLDEADQLSKELDDLNKRLAALIGATKQERPGQRHTTQEAARRLYSGTMVVAERIGDTEQLWNPTKEQVLYKRVFHAASLDAPAETWCGGRLYATFQNVPKERRPLILLAGEQTIELDYSGHHPRLLYHLESLEFSGDPYAIPFHWPDACSGLSDKDRRTIWKKALNTALNAADVDDAMGSVRVWLLDQAEDARSGRLHWLDEGKRYVTLAPPTMPNTDKAAGYRAATYLVPELFKAIESAHQPIAHHFYKSAWRQLQTVDAMICLRVMQQMLGKDIPCLSLHDSFLVKERHKGVLIQVMTEEYRQVIHSQVGYYFNPVIK